MIEITSTDNTYQEKKEVEDFEYCEDASIQGLEEYIKKSKEMLISPAGNSIDS